MLKVVKDAFPGIAMVVPGVEDPETNGHGDNESQHLGIFYNSINSMVNFLVTPLKV